MGVLVDCAADLPVTSDTVRSIPLFPAFCNEHFECLDLQSIILRSSSMELDVNQPALVKKMGHRLMQVA
jgi:hypothetical protein